MLVCDNTITQLILQSLHGYKEELTSNSYIFQKKSIHTTEIEDHDADENTRKFNYGNNKHMINLSEATLIETCD
jgi:hypothetical protein